MTFTSKTLLSGAKILLGLAFVANAYDEFIIEGQKKEEVANVFISTSSFKNFFSTNFQVEENNPQDSMLCILDVECKNR